MSVELLETIKQQIAGLSPQQRSELILYLQEQEKQDVSSSAASPDSDAAEIMRQRRAQWLKTHRDEFGGQYVALDGDRLVGTGRNFHEALQAARALGVAQSFVTYLPKTDEIGYMGDWL